MDWKVCVWFLVILLLCIKEHDCLPEYCTKYGNCRCENGVEDKFSCRDLGSINNLISLLPSTITELKITHSNINRINKNTFSKFTSLKVLTLQNNKIKFIHPLSFALTKNLEEINLQSNRLIRFEIHSGLQKLERLNLQKNQLSYISKTFFYLKSLKSLNVRKNKRLKCTCETVWLLEKNIMVEGSCKLITRGKKRFKREKLSELAVEDLCPPLPFMQPENSQILFIGDSFEAYCTMKSRDPTAKYDTSNLKWRLNGIDLKNRTNSSESFHIDINKHDIKLTVPVVDLSLQGILACSDGTDKYIIKIIVYDSNDTFCGLDHSSSLKGNYTWKMTVSNTTVIQKCKSPRKANIERYCNTNGKWTNVNEENCEFLANSTRLLDKLYKNDSSNSLNILGQYLMENSVSFTSEKKNLILILNIIDRHIHKTSVNRDTTHMVLSIISKIIYSNPTVLKQSVINYSLTEKIFKIIKKLAYGIKLGSDDIVQLTFNGLTFYSKMVSTHSGISCSASFGKSLKCTKYVNESDYNWDNYDLYTSYHLPPSNDSTRIILVVFDNEAVFGSDFGENLNYPIIYSSFSPNGEVTGEVDFTIRKDDTGVSLKRFIPGVGVWFNATCIDIEDSALLSFKCRSNFEAAYALVSQESKRSFFHFDFRVRLLGSIAFTGCAVVFLSSIISAILCCRWQKSAPSEWRHSIANLCVSFSLCAALFCVDFIEPPLICSIRPLLLNLFIFSGFCWSISANYVAKQAIFKKVLSIEDDELETAEVDSRSSCFKYYLIGYGLPLLVIGLTAAITLRPKEIGDFQCTQPDFISLYAPSAFFAVIFFFMSFRIECLHCFHLEDEDSENVMTISDCRAVLVCFIMYLLCFVSSVFLILDYRIPFLPVKSQTFYECAFCQFCVLLSISSIFALGIVQRPEPEVEEVSENRVEPIGKDHNNRTESVISDNTHASSSVALPPPPVNLGKNGFHQSSFYNPRQNGIARKFWDRKKEQIRNIPYETREEDESELKQLENSDEDSKRLLRQEEKDETVV
ncbi:DgyrCDS6816 [Dimorphilus gyrociliatus]|uniref:DgyrCDS6816 n=1 Tax=Dimorphilus gyrociliatus TaxID=2664684 RepID=A0A7I8VPS0_9ANNE|nr:DgyrCDS6816 [Dimorphilus gyrociliatus]